MLQMNKKYNPEVVEKKWQGEWGKAKLFNPDIEHSKNKFYNLWMYPYPSAEGLHAGHAFASTGSDIYGRFMRMQGKTVFQPIGYDSFGIHSENYALKIGQTPAEMLKRTTKNFERQLRSLGHGYDWTRTVTVSDVDYYKWTQWIFVQLFKAGLAVRKSAAVNWCPSCKTVLSDEQVIDDKCERCENVVEKKELEQWFFRITEYADRLLENLNKIDWPEKIKSAQRNWIGRSQGEEIEFSAQGGPASGWQIKVFTTRPDTIYGATFITVAPGSQWAKYAGKMAINPATKQEIPVFAADYVLKEYGTGAIMGVPAYDDRDLVFAQEHDLPVVKAKLTKQSFGKKVNHYHLRDWLISRQRYWGPPIPLIHCEKCGWQAVPEKDLPVLLPEIKDYQPKGDGKGPLANHPEFYKTTCPKCGGPAERETDVSDTFLDSSWYFLRYPSVGLKIPWDPQVTRAWLPVDLYFGGAEHAVLHLMYARFIWMVMRDLGYLDFSAKGGPASGWEEPFPRFFAHGLMIKGGAKMSKSRGNVVNPDIYIAKYGADTLRLYLMFIGPMDGSPDFRDSGIEGMRRFVERVWKLFNRNLKIKNQKSKLSPELEIKMHQTIKKVTHDIQHFEYNTAISSLMIYINYLEGLTRTDPVSQMTESVLTQEALQILCLLLNPFAPHLAEELWHEALGNKTFIQTAAWPKYDEELASEENISIIVQINGKFRGIVGSVEQASTDPKIAKWLVGKKIIKTIVVPGKLVNFVASNLDT